MNPVEIGTGKSFKGLAAYLLHDRGQAQTANRVAWAQSYNLDDADPERAWRLMAATAMSADRLKDAAGIKRGKKAVNTAWHFSLNFNPADRPTEAVQRAAVESALKALGLDGHQGLAVAHDDTDHRHVHVMVNLIDPETGLSAASKQPGGKPALLSNSQKKLSTWAKGFEREHGLTVTEGRLANEEKRQRGEKVDARREPRNVYERRRAEEQSPRLALVKQSFAVKAAQLAQEGRDLAAEHRQQWERARIDHIARQNTAWREQRHAQQQLVDRMKEAYKPRWRALFVRQRSEAEDFARGERTVIGRLWHGMAVYKERALHQDRLGGFLAAFSREERQAIVNRHGIGTPDRLPKGTPIGRGARPGPAQRCGWRRRA
ncbi:hypothetical protein CNY89_09840, partial [Amaricoccus sp. HAR-UPW-R2A-40]